MPITEAQEKQYVEDADNAEAKFRVVSYDWKDGGDVVFVKAEAGTGSCYVVTIAELPDAGERVMGGKHLITLSQPRPASMAYTVFPGEVIDPGYIMEKLCSDLPHGGDRKAVCLTVNKAIEFATEAGIL
ncbi:adenylyltransferase [Arthrobacter phage DanielleIgnace]|nr:adenylyltransferase [Arthrobacter phage DanielleIgnace]